MRAAYLLIMITALLVGCGQKGPLYMSDTRPASAQPLGGDRLDDQADNDSSSQDDQDSQ